MASTPSAGALADGGSGPDGTPATLAHQVRQRLDALNSAVLGLQQLAMSGTEEQQAALIEGGQKVRTWAGLTARVFPLPGEPEPEPLPEPDKPPRHPWSWDYYRTFHKTMGRGELSAAWSAYKEGHASPAAKAEAKAKAEAEGQAAKDLRAEVEGYRRAEAKAAKEAEKQAAKEAAREARAKAKAESDAAKEAKAAEAQAAKEAKAAEAQAEAAAAAKARGEAKAKAEANGKD